MAGRAGRGEYAGRVLLQTYQPEHPVLTAICASNRDSFMQTDMMGRKMANMPPYGQLIAVIVEGQCESVLQSYCNALRDAIPNLKGAKIMGPITAQIYQIRNWYRMRFLVAGGRTANLQPIVSNWLAGLGANGKTRTYEPNISRNHSEIMLEYLGANIKTGNDDCGYFVQIKKHRRRRRYFRVSRKEGKEKKKLDTLN